MHYFNFTNYNHINYISYNLLSIAFWKYQMYIIFTESDVIYKVFPWILPERWPQNH